MSFDTCWEPKHEVQNLKFIIFIYLFGILRHFQHCIGHITMGSLKGRGNQYIQFVRVLYCKLPTYGKQLPAFPLEAMPGTEPHLRGGRQECYHSATVGRKNPSTLMFWACAYPHSVNLGCVMSVGHVPLYLTEEHGVRFLGTPSCEIGCVLHEFS